MYYVQLKQMMHVFYYIHALSEKQLQKESQHCYSLKYQLRLDIIASGHLPNLIKKNKHPPAEVSVYAE